MKNRGFSASIVHLFITSKLSILLLAASLIAGAAALLLTPREEEPQIVVPMADILVEVPGASAESVEKRVSTPLEILLREIDGVEYVYAASRPGEAMVTVRFLVGENREDSLVKVWNKLMSHQDVIPPEVSRWRVKPVEIDDVPILTVTLSGIDHPPDIGELRRYAEELQDKLATVHDSGRISLYGGNSREIRIYPDPNKLAVHQLTLSDLLTSIEINNLSLEAGQFDQGIKEIRVHSGPPLSSASEVAHLIIAQSSHGNVYLGDVAKIEDAHTDTTSYTRIGFGGGSERSRQIQPEGKTIHHPQGEWSESVTIAVAKRKGANAVHVAEDTLKLLESLRGHLLPENISMTVSRNYGETADEKVNELVKHLAIAIATIIVLLAFSLGTREAFIVAIAVPMTLGITLLFDLICGYTINRVTLFALILALGLLVDDPIVDVENIYRHFRMRKEPPLEAALTAVDEVRPPTIYATLAVIVSFLPLFYISGMMGPYMAPMAFNVPIAMLMSLLVAFTVTPWASYYLLKPLYDQNDGVNHHDADDEKLMRIYRQIIGPLIQQPERGKKFLWLVLAAFIGASLLAVYRVVPLKLLPYDNKNELRLVIDMPRGNSLESTDALARELESYLGRMNEVTDFESYVGIAAPMDFNGMVRHYYLRRGGHLAEIHINLLAKHERQQQSHEIALRIRPDIEAIAARHGARIKILETPPGPPVLSTFVAEVYAPLDASIASLNRVTEQVRDRVADIPGIKDIDDLVDDPEEEWIYHLDRTLAGHMGIHQTDVTRTLQIALGELTIGTLQIPSEHQPLQIRLKMARKDASSQASLLKLEVRGVDGQRVSLGDIGRLERRQRDTTIYHKNLKRLNYVTAEMIAATPVDAVLAWHAIEEAKPMEKGFTVDLAGEGEWKITVDVFRDLGLAFGAALLMIYVLLVAQTGSMSMPLIIMIAIPLTIIGIMPGFWLLNLFTSDVAGYGNPVLFTATGMIGMIALAGIVVRNSIILIDFIERLRSDGVVLADAIVKAGATRLRPIFLTAAAAMSGSFIITLDPIFSGLAWSFIFGIFASTAFSLIVVPLVYFLLNDKGKA